MPATYGTVLTDLGGKMIADCILNGTQLDITQSAVGDGGGACCLPTASQTGLVNEVWRGGIADASLNISTPNMIDIKIIIPDSTSGFVVREAALFSSTGDCIAICNLPDTQKAGNSSGTSGKLVIVMHILVTDASVVNVVVNPALNTVSQQQMDAAIAAAIAGIPTPEDIVIVPGGGSLSMPPNLGPAPFVIEFTEEDDFEPGVGRSLAGQIVEPTQGTAVTASDGAEIFNDYRARTFDAKGEVTAGNIASGSHSHAEGDRNTASGTCSHAEGSRNIASEDGAHAEGAYSLASGRCAHSEGLSTTASGNMAHAEGMRAQATGESSHAEGVDCTASGWASHVEGHSSKASAQYSHAEGFMAESIGMDSHAEGRQSKALKDADHTEGFATEASGPSSHAEGRQTKTTAEASHAEGFLTSATGDYSHAEGRGTEAVGECSHAAGLCTVANAYQTVIGTCNAEKTDSTQSTGTRFIVGSGSDLAARANCFRVSTTGTFGVGAFNSSGADYAELFEWADGNPDKQDRAGLFVTLDGEKIRPAALEDEFILGIVSAAPSVVGDVYDDQWNGMYLKDIFGRTIYEMQDIPERRAPDGTILRKASQELLPKLNPDYDPSQLYIPRTGRPEWDAVGMLGKLVAVDDGSCQANGWCTAGVGGKATKSEVQTRYRVMSRLDENHIRILVL